jgi:hypothetical protein
MDTVEKSLERLAMLVNTTLISLTFNSTNLNSSSLSSAIRKQLLNSGLFGGGQKQRPWDFGEISLLFLLIFGTVGNSLSIMVMRSRRMRNTNASLFVTCMAISDTILLLFKFISNMVKLYRISIFNFCIPIQIIAQAATFISVWLIMITSSERAAAVLKPLKVAIIFSKKRCKFIIVTMMSIFILLSSSQGLCTHYAPMQPYYCQIRGSQNGTCFYYYNYIFPWIKSSFGSWLPSVLGITLNIVIIVSLYHASDQRKNITSNSRIMNSNGNSGNYNYINTNSNYELEEGSAKKTRQSCEKIAESQGLLKTNETMNKSAFGKKGSNVRSISNLESSQSRIQQQLQLEKESHHHHKERQITIMLLTISLSFVIFTLPYSAFELFRKLDVNTKLFKNRYAMRFCMFLIDLNHSTNFIFYCLTAQRFRDELKSILCSLIGKEEKKNRRTSSIAYSNYQNNKNSCRNEMKLKREKALLQRQPTEMPSNNRQSDMIM